MHLTSSLVTLLAGMILGIIVIFLLTWTHEELLNFCLWNSKGIIPLI